MVFFNTIINKRWINPSKLTVWVVFLTKNFVTKKSLDPRSVEIIKVNIYYQVNLGIFDTYEKATEKLTEVQKSISNS